MVKGQKELSHMCTHPSLQVSCSPVVCPKHLPHMISILSNGEYRIGPDSHELRASSMVSNRKGLEGTLPAGAETGPHEWSGQITDRSITFEH